MPSILQKPIAILLFPLTIWYAVSIAIRNLLFQKGLLKRQKYDLPVISVGNITTGGTGKTPQVEYLIRLLNSKFHPAVLSRGYSRKTKGFILADKNSTAETIGDEPLQYYQKFHSSITAAVCEDRNTGISSLLKQTNPPDVIILDDAFQHRYVKPSLNILLTDYAKPFYKDQILPFGSLREFRSAYRRADIIVVTKCPEQLKETEKRQIMKKLHLSPSQNVFFSSIKYGLPAALTNHPFSHYEDILVFSGIANPQSFYDFIEKKHRIQKMAFPDHHAYSEKDIRSILKQFNRIPSESKALITTEKDAARLQHLKAVKLLESIPLFYLPIEIYFHPSEESFDEKIFGHFQQSALFDFVS